MTVLAIIGATLVTALALVVTRAAWTSFVYWSDAASRLRYKDKWTTPAGVKAQRKVFFIYLAVWAGTVILWYTLIGHHIRVGWKP